MGGNPLQMRPDRFPEAKPQQSRQETQEAPKVKGTPTRTEPDLTGEDAQTPTTLPPEPGSTPSEPGPSYSEPDPAPQNLAPPLQSLAPPTRSLAPPLGAWPCLVGKGCGPLGSAPLHLSLPGVRNPQAASLQVL